MRSIVRHRTILKSFLAIMIAHWAEHIVQAYQVYVMGCERHNAMGLPGRFYPWLVHSEWLHFGYAIATWLGLVILRSGFSGTALHLWDMAIIIQIWHSFEHTLLFIQAQRGFTLWGAAESTSVLQLFWPRIELHLFYNSVVTLPIILAMVTSSRQHYRTPQLATAGNV